MPTIDSATIDAQVQAILNDQTRFNTIRKQAYGDAFVYGDHATVDNSFLAQGPEGVRQRIIQIYQNAGYTVGGPSTPEEDPFNESAWAFIARILDDYGLSELLPWAKEQIIAGHSADWIALELRNQPAFQRRFAAIFQRQQNGLNPISPDEVIAYETQARQLMRSAGMPEGFFDRPDDFVRLLSEDVSVVELADRVNEGYLRVASQGAEVRQAFQAMFGPSGDAALAAYFIDPDRALPVLRQQVGASEFGGAGLRFGFQIGKETALDAAALGKQQGADRGFAALYDMRGLFDESISETTDLTAEREGVAAVFDVGDPAGRDKVRKRQDERRAAFSGDSGVSVGRSGAAALGSAD